MSTLVTYDKPDLPAVGRATQNASHIVVDDQTTYEIAAIEVSTIKARRSEIDAMRKTIVDPINKAKDAVQAIFNPVLADYDAAEKVIKGKMVVYTHEQAEIQRKAQAEADRVAREEAAKAAKQAAKLEKAGRTEEAEAVREIASVSCAVTVAPTLEKVAGISNTTKWKGKIVDESAFLTYVASHPEYHALVEILQGAVDRAINASKGKLVLPGVENYQDLSIGVRK